MTTPYADAVYRDAIQRLPPEAESSSVSLLAVPFGRVHQTGTGALVRVATDRFLVTAAHVITQAERAKCPLSIASKFGNAVPLSGKVVYTTPTDFDGDDDDLADVAVYQLDPAVVAQLPDGCQFLGLESIALNDDLVSDLYVTLGIPTEWTPSVPSSSERGLHGPALKYLMTWRPPETPSPDFRNYDPNIHLLLNADPEKRYAPDGETVVELSGLKGLSGSAVWRCHIHERLPPRVVAVQTSTYRSREGYGLARGAEGFRQLLSPASTDSQCAPQSRRAASAIVAAPAPQTALSTAPRSGVGCPRRVAWAQP